MAVDPPVTHTKFGSSTHATEYTVTYAPSAAVCAATLLPPEVRKREARKALILAWKLGRMAEAWRVERARPEPAAWPPKARTEWGMVHRERCVHRMGLN